ncbi:LysR family transcriptional regulator [Geodermatophilus sabuli]|uniref:DNA-binding transcriptional regulator, LysR family n=1 Tax=Geodermatophilus sabuli TaxID=1564158 RepID=A0A285EHC2_9ACTN|nr:LysR family transcriptional regulator [Geodermatophilus sabuli]MBB3083868.1 DNA-binding transcriptional LysR family regulator [Geodermatophilus sabuli]SNX98519.1 DNA-binding transcriptional regulator, LysR family [Geodermatophilus sabuli]
MELRSLEMLRAVHTQGGVTAAAAVLHLTPSAVSQQLAALTREMGVPLTERVGRGVQLTPAGAALADAAGEVAVAVERARAACGVFLDSPRGTVRVSAFQSGARLLLPDLLTRVARVGGITLECSDEDVALADFAALTDRVDIVIAHRPDRGPQWVGGGLRVVPLLREPLDVAVAADHPLAGGGGVRPEDLVGQDWITVREGFPVATVLDAVAARSGTAPRITHRINDFTVVEALVAAGHGISLLPRYSCGGHPGVRLLPLAGVRAGRRVDALLRRDHAERLVVRRVLDELVAVAAGIGERA